MRWLTQYKLEAKYIGIGKTKPQFQNYSEPLHFALTSF